MWPWPSVFPTLGRTTGNGNVIEFMRLTVPDTVLWQIAHARKVEGEVGRTEFTLGDSQLARVRAYVDSLPKVR